MPAALGHLGRCWPSIGLRFTHARRNAAPRTVPHGPRPDGAGPTAAPIARMPARHAHGTPAAHPIAAAGACRGCCPAAVTLCVNRAALARALIYINLDVIGGRSRAALGNKTEPRGQVGGARSGHVIPICRGELSHGPPMRSHPRFGGIVGKRGCDGNWRALRAGDGTAERWHGVCVPGIGFGYNSPSPPARHLRRAGWLVPNLRSRISVCGCLVPPRTYHATAFTAISSEFFRTHKSTLSTGGHCVASRPVSTLSIVAGVVPNHCACLGF